MVSNSNTNYWVAVVFVFVPDVPEVLPVPESDVVDEVLEVVLPSLVLVDVFVPVVFEV